MNRKLILLLAISLTLHQAGAQQKAVIAEINEEVWKPFIKAFNSGDDAGFKAIHSKDVIRVLQDDQDIFGYERYFQQQPDSIKSTWTNWKKNIELRFIQRIAANEKAFEVGYYKTTNTNRQTGEVRKSIGKFHVLMRKENGAWKILMDADTREGANEDVFSKADALQ